MSEQLHNEFKEDAYSKSIRAGKRTYFFDIKVTSVTMRSFIRAEYIIHSLFLDKVTIYFFRKAIPLSAKFQRISINSNPPML